MEIIIDKETSKKIVDMGTRKPFRLLQTPPTPIKHDKSMTLLIGTIGNTFQQNSRRDEQAEVIVGSKKNKVMKCVSPLSAPDTKLLQGQWVLVLETGIGNIIIGADCADEELQ